MEQNRSMFPLVKMTKVLGVSMSGFYTWKKSPIFERETPEKSFKTRYDRSMSVIKALLVVIR
jgi:hypothetical protein